MSGAATASIARGLGLGASPTFALMALQSSLDAHGVEGLCSAGAGPLSSMTVMYLLMSAFHAPAWLKLLTGRAPLRQP